MSRKRNMFAEIKETIIRRFLFIFVVMQIGLVSGLYGLILISQNDSVYGTSIWYALVGAIILLYGGFLLALYFILAPLYRLYQKYQVFLQWRSWLLSELPRIIEIIVAGIRQIRRAFDSGTTPSKTSNSTPTPPSGANDDSNSF